MATLFLRFLRFGCLAWGGPVAQIGMMKHDLVERERWVTPERFNRALAVYQVLPGPEATELACWFGMISRGRRGALLAGLGFVLPGFILMLALSWAYVAVGITGIPMLAAAFVAMKPAVMALIIRAVHRISTHALHDGWLLGLAAGAAVASLAGVHFAPILVVAGLAYALVGRGLRPAAAAVVALAAAGALWWSTPPGTAVAPSSTVAPEVVQATLPALALSGFKAGMLTFGGAYTVIPFLRGDAVAAQQWITDAQFLDGLALSGVLPAPLIIFSAFIGYLAGGLAGALVMTFFIFLPAFAFTLIGHEFFERIIEHKPIHAFLDGITAGVVGLIAATACALVPETVDTPATVAIAGGALVVLYKSKSKPAIPLVVLGAGVIGAALHQVH